MIPAAIRTGKIMMWLSDHSGFVVSLDMAGGAAGVVCPGCPENGAMAFCVVRQTIEADGRLTADYRCLRCTDDLLVAA